MDAWGGANCHCIEVDCIIDEKCMHCIRVVECSNEIFQAGFVTKRVDQWLQSMMDFFHLYHRGALDGNQEWRASASTSNTWTVNGTEISREITKSAYFGPTNFDRHWVAVCWSAVF